MRIALTKYILIFAAGMGVGAFVLHLTQRSEPVPTASVMPTTGIACDSLGYVATAQQVESIRASRRIDEATFVRMTHEPKTVIIDARSRMHYENLHIKGSISLPYTEFSEQTLSRVIPDKETRVLIYCRNNLLNTATVATSTAPAYTGSIAEFQYPTEFDPPKIPQAGLNIPTFITLHTYGYRNVWELDSQVDPKHTSIAFE